MISNLEFKTCNFVNHLLTMNISTNYYDYLKTFDHTSISTDYFCINKPRIKIFILIFDFFSRIKSIFGEKEKTQILTRKQNFLLTVSHFSVISKM